MHFHPTIKIEIAVLPFAFRLSVGRKSEERGTVPPRDGSSDLNSDHEPYLLHRECYKG